MSYTPINWQTGDTITAEKMNKMDNGWGMQATQLFSETVTTADDGMDNNFGAFIYTSLIAADTITVTFDSVDYTCPRIDAFDQYYYGGFTGEEFDYSDYPFAIVSDGSEGNFLYTENAGTYTVVADVQGIEISENFSSAVNACANGIFYITATWDDTANGYLLNKTLAQIQAAYSNGQLCKISGGIISEIQANESPWGGGIFFTITPVVNVDPANNLLAYLLYNIDQSTGVVSVDEYSYTLTPASS